LAFGQGGSARKPLSAGRYCRFDRILVAGAYRYYLTRLGRAAIAAACSITEMRIIPTLAAAR
jgi:hypothetical protein